jgi:hypothetical protein
LSFSAAHRRLTALRVTALGLGRPTTSDPVAVVRGLLALQAQDYPGALWSIGLRTTSATRAALELLHESGSVVRSWTMRGTLHFVAVEDLRWILSLTGERMVRAAEGRRRRLGVDTVQLGLAEQIVRERLAGGATASRAELFTAFESGGLATTGERGTHLLGHLAQTSVTVLVGKTEWALLDHRAPTPVSLSRDAALREFALRYFHGHGPATVRDFAWWSSLTLTEARVGLEAAREELEHLDVDGEQYFQRPGLEPTTEGTWLLPGFDEYLLGYTDRRAPLAGADTSLIAPGANGLFLATIVVDGEVVGTWRRVATSKKVTVTVTPFGVLGAAHRRAIAAESARLGDFLEVPVEIA